MIIPNWQAILDGAENTARVPVAPGQSVVWEIPLDEDNPFVTPHNFCGLALTVVTGWHSDGNQRIIYQVGHDYAVQPRVGAPSVGRVRIKSIEIAPGDTGL